MRLIEANRRDQRQAAYATFDELVDYCDLSANPVGELVLHVFGAATPDRVALSDDVCTALQLVEHWQDVPRTTRTAASTCRARTSIASASSRRFVRRRGVPASCSPSRSSARGRCSTAGAPLVGTLRGRARLAVAGYVGGGRARRSIAARRGRAEGVEGGASRSRR